MPQEKTIAFFTPEVALANEIRAYSGGLGTFSAGFGVSAKKLGIPAVGVSILPSEGHYEQGIDLRGRRMTVEYLNYLRRGAYNGILEDTGVVFSIRVCRRPVQVRVWRLPDGGFGSIPWIFLSTDIDENDYLSRLNTLQLYGGSRASGANTDRRIVQAIVLGRGGIQALRRFYPDVSLHHLNESHTFFAALELLRLAKGDMRKVKDQVVFTTHTPVAAGNPQYWIGDVMRLASFGKTLRKEDLLPLCIGEQLNATALCLRLARKANAVSKKHLAVAEKMWHWVPEAAPLVSITNGASRDFWQFPEFRSAGSAGELRAAKMSYKKAMLDVVRRASGKNFKENVLTVVWARRFAEYKRPKLLFHDLEWLRSRLASGEFQLIVAGKPHPDDQIMTDVWNELYGRTFDWPNVAVLAGYELDMMKTLKAGADLWLNTPRAPNEACGTSGMGAAMCGAVNVSTPDGWMAEADPKNCLLFGSPWQMVDQDAHDAEELREKMREAVSLFYSSEEKWYEMALGAKREAEDKWTTDRMVEEYAEKLYRTRS